MTLPRNVSEISRSNLLAHGGHIFASNLATFGLTNKKPDRVIFADNQDEGIANAAVSNPWSRHIAIRILDSLALGSICTTFRHTRCVSRYMNAPGSRTRTTLATLNMTWSIAVPWKKGAAPMVVPGIRVVICISP